ncbi:MAG: site-specific DNA-methyltransferase [Christensenellaceae bacterium]|jgi:adenine-specific DNA-methyltransferase|nr:site-specific DNA-methyltransferase [Christensenellaceae bacterium]
MLGIQKEIISNIEKIETLFPNCMTEAIIDGVVTKAVDFDVLKEELSHFSIEDGDLRYQFNWAGKKKSAILANYPINKTLRPVRVNEIVAQSENESRKAYFRSGSVDFENTKNLYIEGADLEVLKLLQETYLNKIKMIYIGAPSEDESSFTLEDDSLEIEGKTKIEREKNQFQNRDYGALFHTNWLNKIYPVLKIAKDLLREDGVILINMDDERIHILRKICDEIFGASNFYGQIVYGINTELTSKTIEKVLNISYAIRERSCHYF